LSAGIESNGINFVVMSLMKSPLLLTNGKKSKLSIIAGGGQQSAIRREGDCINVVTVAAEGLHQLGIAGLPELYCFVMTSGRQVLAIGAEGEAVYILLMRLRFFL